MTEKGKQSQFLLAVGDNPETTQIVFVRITPFEYWTMTTMPREKTYRDYWQRLHPDLSMFHQLYSLSELYPNGISVAPRIAGRGIGRGLSVRPSRIHEFTDAGGTRMSSSPTKTTLFRRLVFAAAPLVVLLLVWPAKHAYADIFSAFTDCFTTVTSLGGSTSNIDGTSNQQAQFLTNTIYPQSLIGQAALVDLYDELHVPAMDDQRNGAPDKQRHHGQLQPIGVCHARRHRACRRRNCSHPFRATYGAPVSATGAAPFTQTVTDMSDSQALDVFSLTSASDFTANTLISQSHTVEDSGAAVAPGNADHAALQAKALELYSAAIRHKLLAANLRLESVELANTTGAIKQQMVHPVPASTYLVSGSSASSTADTSGSANNQTSTQTAK